MRIFYPRVPCLVACRMQRLRTAGWMPCVVSWLRMLPPNSQVVQVSKDHLKYRSISLRTTANYRTNVEVRRGLVGCKYQILYMYAFTWDNIMPVLRISCSGSAATSCGGSATTDTRPRRSCAHGGRACRSSRGTQRGQSETGDVTSLSVNTCRNISASAKIYGRI